jgi:hypothetical protein
MNRNGEYIGPLELFIFGSFCWVLLLSAFMAVYLLVRY